MIIDIKSLKSSTSFTLYFPYCSLCLSTSCGSVLNRVLWLHRCPRLPLFVDPMGTTFDALSLSEYGEADANDNGGKAGIAPHVLAASLVQSSLSSASTALLEYFAMTMATMVANADHHHGDHIIHSIGGTDPSNH